MAACNLLLAFGGDFFLVRLAPIHSADEIVPQPNDRLLLPALLDFFRRAITRRIVGGGVITKPVGDGLYQAWSVPRPSEAIAASAAARTAMTSLPSTCSPEKPAAMAFCASVCDAVCSRSGTEIAH